MKALPSSQGQGPLSSTDRTKEDLTWLVGAEGASSQASGLLPWGPWSPCSLCLSSCQVCPLAFPVTWAPEAIRTSVVGYGKGGGSVFSPAELGTQLLGGYCSELRILLNQEGQRGGLGAGGAVAGSMRLLVLRQTGCRA